MKISRATWLLAGAVTTCLVLAPPAAAARASRMAAKSIPVTVPSKQTFTDTGLTVNKGDTITIRAAGTVQFQSGRKQTTTPAGRPWTTACLAIARAASDSPFPAPGLPCWSLIAKVGTKSAPFEVGMQKTFVAPTSGSLFLGINDNYVADNAGAWTASLTTTSATSSGGSSSLLPLVAAGVGLLIAALLVWWVIARRRKPAPKPAAPRAPKPSPTPEPVMAATVPRMTPEERANAAPFDPESTDVNIFRVELSEGAMMKVGYSFFPEGTEVQWRVAQGGATVASGAFVAEGGGSVQHFESLPLDVTLRPDANGADVHFSWTIGDVPFAYNVRRDPGL